MYWNLHLLTANRCSLNSVSLGRHPDHAEFSSALQDPEPAFEKAEQGIVLLIPGYRTFGKRAGKRRTRRSIWWIADHRVQAAGRNVFRLFFHIPAADPDPWFQLIQLDCPFSHFCCLISFKPVRVAILIIIKSKDISVHKLTLTIGVEKSRIWLNDWTIMKW